MRTFSNPVLARSFPDPFVLEHDGVYWGFATGRAPDGRCFPVATSTDLVHWEARPGAMAPLPGDAPCYWAPEVTRNGASFVLYYSVGNEDTMQIRAAVATEPGGPYLDAGRALTTEPFAIDPHVFEDEDGTRWLFYATDFLTHTHVGTGTVRDRLLDPFTLEGKPQPVTRARHAWQVYDPARKEKGGVRWHTVEGPFVLKRRGLYYEMFSGGNWKNVTYGVSYATARSLEAPGEWDQHALPILRTVPGRVLGPGHNSVVLGPDGRQLYCVYHRWQMDREERVLCIDRLDWAGERLLVLGPSDAGEPVPLPPTRVLQVDRERPIPLPAPTFLLQWTSSPPLSLALRTGSSTVWSWEKAEGACSLRLEVSGRRVRCELRGEGVRWTGEIAVVPDTLVFLSGGGRAALTFGFEDLFETPPEVLGWRPASGTWQPVEDGLLCNGAGDVGKDASIFPAEVVVSARALPGGGYGLSLGDVLRLAVTEEGDGFRLDGPGVGRPLPRTFAGREFQQLRLRMDPLATRLFWERAFLATLPPVRGRLALGLQAHGRGAVFDSARMTARPEEDP